METVLSVLLMETVLPVLWELNCDVCELRREHTILTSRELM